MKFFLSMFAITTLVAIPQVRDRATTTAKAALGESDAATIARGWTAAAAGQFDNAATAADSILRRRPWDRAALTLKISARASLSPLSGLDAYEQWVAAGHKDDAALLEPVSIAVLRELSKGSDAGRRSSALSALATAQVAGAREALDAATASQPQPQAKVAADADAALHGDAAAVGRLNAQAGDRTAASVALAEALEQIGSGGEPGLLMLVNAANPAVRKAAVRALVTMKSERALSVFQSLFDGMDPATRIPATIALAQNGDPRALARVDQMLASNVPDVQIAAAEAWSGRPGPWVEVIRPLLDNQDGFTRLDAARVIAPVDPDAAKRTLGAGLDDLNPAIRYESAKSIDALIDHQPALSDVETLRKKLRDTDPMVRLTVASTLLRLARSR
jgi:hypothetical protein